MSKTQTCGVCGIISGAVTIGGAIGITVATGGGALIAGMALGAGISGTLNLVQQA